MANSLLKSAAHNSFADGIYKEIISRTTRYYYFLGKTIAWANESIPPRVVDSYAYERDCRNEIIATKEITPSDISFVIPRKNWSSNTIYDIYDDQYSSEIQGLNLVSGGSLYAVTPTITIGTVVPVSSTILINTQYFYNGNLYTVKSGGLTGSSNTVLLGIFGTDYIHGGAILTCVGIQATATCTVGSSGVNHQKVISTTMVIRGYGYTTIPTVTFSSGIASAVAILTNGIGGISKLENTNYYAYNDYNTYICINNNNNAVSTVAPSGISSDYLTTADGYTWKYISSVPSNSKFLTTDYIPVYTATHNNYNANGSIINVYIDNPGNGYFSATNIIPLSTTVFVGEQYYYSGYIYEVTEPFTFTGSIAVTTGILTLSATTSIASHLAIGQTISGTNIVSGTTITSLLSGTIGVAGSTYQTTQYTAAASTTITVKSTSSGSYSGLGNAIGIPYLNGGAVFTTLGADTSITISGDGSNASLTPLITDGSLSSVQINNYGENYTFANFTVNGAGNGATISSTLYTGVSQYTHQAQIEASTIKGNICSIKLISYGYGYTNPVVTISGDGNNATATATVVNGLITKINIVNRGSNYNWATISIIDSTGAGALARAIVSPKGGLGADPINQFNSKSLMFYAKISDNTNHGLIVSNDYRQVGIIKDPNRYRESSLLTSNFATPCWKITATALINVGILVDDILTAVSNSTTFRFRVVAISNSEILLIPLDNGIPVSGMQFIKTSLIYFISAYVTPPTIDKYSGDLLFIDNESNFVATTNSPAILRTVINF